jgi:hypothetical protein
MAFLNEAADCGKVQSVCTKSISCPILNLGKNNKRFAPLKLESRLEKYCNVVLFGIAETEWFYKDKITTHFLFWAFNLDPITTYRLPPIR